MSNRLTSQQVGVPLLEALGMDLAREHVVSATLEVGASGLPQLTVVREIWTAGQPEIVADAIRRAASQYSLVHGDVGQELAALRQLHRAVITPEANPRRIELIAEALTAVNDACVRGGVTEHG